MANGLTNQIASWFSDHADGEFVRAAANDPYLFSESDNEFGRVVYTTKPTTLMRILRQYHLANGVTTIGRYGLPNEQDVTQLLSFVRDRQIAFLGDADPVDLLIFAWLRAHFPIEYLGINQSVIESLGTEIDDTTTIPLSDSELASMPLMTMACPDYSDLLGPKCTQHLKSGK